MAEGGQDVAHGGRVLPRAVETRDSGFGSPLNQRHARDDDDDDDDEDDDGQRGGGGAGRGRNGGGVRSSSRKKGGRGAAALSSSKSLDVGGDNALSEREIAMLMHSADADHFAAPSPGVDTADQATVSVGLFG